MHTKRQYTFVECASLTEKLDIKIYWEMGGSFTNENIFSYDSRSSHHYTTNKQDAVVIL